MRAYRFLALHSSVGIEVQDEDGHVVGKSTSAGWLAVSQTAASRVATAFPALTLPPLVLSQLEKTSAFRAMPGLAIPVNLGIIMRRWSVVTLISHAISTEHSSADHRIANACPSLRHRHVSPEWAIARSRYPHI